MPQSAQPIQIGAWLADPSDDSLTQGEKSQRIEPRMMRLLMCLARSPGKVVSQEQLLNEVWAGVVVSPASVYQSISQLRKLLGDTESPPAYIETVPRKGYRLVADVRSIEHGRTPEPTTAFEQTQASAALVSAQAKPQRHWLLASVVLIIFAVVAASVWRLQSRAPEGGPASIVVLPFLDFTPEKNEQPFCDGLTEELSNWLAQIPTLKVVARTSAFAFRNAELDAREIGKRLGVTHVLEGSLRRGSDGSRITVQVIDARDGFHVWSGAYDIGKTDIVRVQEEIARAVAMNLELRLTPTTDERFAARHGTSSKAYTSYLLARHHQQQLTREDNERAIHLYEAAIAEDPKFSLAKVGLAYALLNERYFSDRTVEEIEPQVRALLDHAAALTPHLADLYIVRGALATELHDRRAALAALTRAVELNPNSSQAASELGFYHLTAGEPMRAVEYYTRAVNLDPLAFNLHATRCVALADLAQFSEASASCERARALNPGVSWTSTASGLLEHSRGRFVEALAWNNAALLRSPGTVDSYAERGRWLLELGALDLARAAHDKAIAVAGTEAVRSAPLVRVGLITSVAQGHAAALHDYLSLHSLEQTTDPAIMFEIAAAYLMIDDATTARQWVDRALASPALTEEELNSAWSARTGSSNLLIAAHAMRATGNAASADRYVQQATKLVQRLQSSGMRRHGLLELDAQLAAARGDAASAANTLQRAAQLGWRSVWLAEHEPHFKAIRDRADVRKLLVEVEQQNRLDLKRLEANR